MSGFEVGGLVLAVFLLVIEAIKGVLANESSLRLWEAQACRIELEAIQFEIQVQEALFQNSYLKLLSAFLDRCQTIKLLADPDGLRNNNAEITKKLKSHLGDQWTVYQGLMRRLENTLRTFKASVDKVCNFVCRKAIYGDCKLTRVCGTDDSRPAKRRRAFATENLVTSNSIQLLHKAPLRSTKKAQG